MFFFKKTQKSQKQKRGRRPGAGPEPAAPERLVTVHVAEGAGLVPRVFVIPASHLGRPRLAPLVAQSEEEHGGGRHWLGNDVVRVECRLCHFVDAMVWTAVEEAMEGRTAHGEQPGTVDCGDDGESRDLAWYLARPH